jgi:hypothetical protein
MPPPCSPSCARSTKRFRSPVTPSWSGSRALRVWCRGWRICVWKRGGRQDRRCRCRRRRWRRCGRGRRDRRRWCRVGSRVRGRSGRGLVAGRQGLCRGQGRVCRGMGCRGSGLGGIWGRRRGGIGVGRIGGRRGLRVRWAGRRWRWSDRLWVVPWIRRR